VILALANAIVVNNARADVTAPASADGNGALALEPAHGPYADLAAYRADFARIDPRGFYLPGHEDEQCAHAIEGIEPLEAAGLEVRSVAIGGGNGECHLAIRRLPDGQWYFLESGATWSGRSDSTIAQVKQLHRRGGGAWQFLLQVDYRRFWNEIAENDESMTSWYLCSQFMLACRVEANGAFACTQPIAIANVDRCYGDDGHVHPPPPLRRWDYAYAARLTGDQLALSLVHGQKQIDASERRLLDGVHPLVRGAGNAALQQLITRPRNSENWARTK
jgi:hypothetical protein